MKKMIPVIAAIVLIIIIIAVSGGLRLIDKFSYSKEMADLTEYYGIESEGEVPIVLQNERIEESALLKDGKYYLDLDSVHRYLNERFYEDRNEGLLLYSLAEETVSNKIGTDSFESKAGAEAAGYTVSFYEGEKLYLALDYVKKYTNFSYEPFTEPNRIQIDTEWTEQKSAKIGKATAVRLKGGVKSPILRELAEGDQVTVLEEMEKWSKVKTEDALIGYVENKRLTGYSTISPIPVTDYQEPEYKNISKPYKINLGWHTVAGVAGNDTLPEVLAASRGLTTISPTWFALTDNEGNFSSFATKEYVNTAHEKGVEVWGLIDNFTNKENVDTYEVLSYTSKRTKLIGNLVQTALDFGLDGINLDFEEISMDAGEHYIQFVRELSIACRASGIVLSVDNYVPTGYTDHYNRKEQGIFADYVVIMGYDEHYRGSDKAGSVASIGFVEEGIRKTVDQVPPEKVINAVPFYTRIWETKGNELLSQAVGMEMAEKFVADKKIELVWDEAACQNYGELQTEESFWQVWLEDEDSIKVKLDIMDQYKIAGVASWRLGFEKSSIWDVIGEYLAK